MSKRITLRVEDAGQVLTDFDAKLKVAAQVTELVAVETGKEVERKPYAIKFAMILAQCRARRLEMDKYRLHILQLNGAPWTCIAIATALDEDVAGKKLLPPLSEDAQKSIKAIMQSIDGEIDLRNVSLPHPNYPPSQFMATIIFVIIEKCNLLRKIDLWDSPIRDDTVALFASSLPKLQEISLGHSTEYFDSYPVEPVTMAAWLQFVSNDHVQGKLVSLKVSGRIFGSEVNHEEGGDEMRRKTEEWVRHLSNFDHLRVVRLFDLRGPGEPSDDSVGDALKCRELELRNVDGLAKIFKNLMVHPRQLEIFKAEESEVADALMFVDSVRILTLRGTDLKDGQLQETLARNQKSLVHINLLDETREEILAILKKTIPHMPNLKTVTLSYGGHPKHLLPIEPERIRNSFWKDLGKEQSKGFKLTLVGNVDTKKQTLLRTYFPNGRVVFKQPENAPNDVLLSFIHKSLNRKLILQH